MAWHIRAIAYMLSRAKIEENTFVVFVMENLMAKNGSIPSRSKKEAMFVTNSQTDGQMDGQTDRQGQRQKIIDS